jgi:hypothetical protein
MGEFETVSVCGEGGTHHDHVQEVRLEEANAPGENKNRFLPIDWVHLNKCEFLLDGSELSVQDVHIACLGVQSCTLRLGTRRTRLFLLFATRISLIGPAKFVKHSISA